MDNKMVDINKEEQEFLKQKAYIEELSTSNNIEELIKLNDKLNEEIAKKDLKTLNYKQAKNKLKKDKGNGNK